MVSIVIPAFNAQNSIEATVRACLQQTYTDLEIIVVDDGSTDNTAAILQRYPVSYLHQMNRGPAAARNAGWRSSRGSIICFTDADCVPHKEWVQTLVKELNSPTIAAAGGSYCIANPHSLLARCIHEEIIQRHLSMPTKVNAMGSYNCAVKRACLEALGGFNEHYKDASAEDNDLSYRIIARGHSIAFSKYALVEHLHPTALFPYLIRQYSHGYWRVKLYKDHPAMARGDNYTCTKDIVEPLLAISVVVLALSLFFFLGLTAIFTFVLLVYAAIQIPTAAKVLMRTKDLSLSTLAGLTFVRGFFRAAGAVTGTLAWIR